jgi:hypothetical protein
MGLLWLPILNVPSTAGPVIYVTSTNAVIKLTGTTIVRNSSELLNASANSWLGGKLIPK